MAQKVISAKDVDLYINFTAIGIDIKLDTASSFTANTTGTTDDIGAISTNEPIATENGGTTYDINFSLQQAEAQTILDALAAATVDREGGSVANIRQLVEEVTITAIWKKLRDVPATANIVTFTNCTGMEENDNVERRSSETLKTWSWRARGMMRTTTPI